MVLCKEVGGGVDEGSQQDRGRCPGLALDACEDDTAQSRFLDERHHESARQCLTDELRQLGHIE